MHVWRALTPRAPSRNPWQPQPHSPLGTPCPSLGRMRCIPSAEMTMVVVAQRYCMGVSACGVPTHRGCSEAAVGPEVLDGAEARVHLSEPVGFVPGCRDSCITCTHFNCAAHMTAVNPALAWIVHMKLMVVVSKGRPTTPWYCQPLPAQALARRHRVLQHSNRTTRPCIPSWSLEVVQRPCKARQRNSSRGIPDCYPTDCSLAGSHVQRRSMSSEFTSDNCSPWWIGRRPLRNALRVGLQCQWVSVHCVGQPQYMHVKHTLTHVKTDRLLVRDAHDNEPSNY